MDRLVEVEFLDHAWGEEKYVFGCRIWGKLVEVDDKQVIVQVWESNKSPSEETEFASIVRPAITAIRPLQYDIPETI